METEWPFQLNFFCDEFLPSYTDRVLHCSNENVVEIYVRLLEVCVDLMSCHEIGMPSTVYGGGASSSLGLFLEHENLYQQLLNYLAQDNIDHFLQLLHEVRDNCCSEEPTEQQPTDEEEEFTNYESDEPITPLELDTMMIRWAMGPNWA